MLLDLFWSLLFVPSTCALTLEWMDHKSGPEFLPEAVPHEVLCLSAVQAPSYFAFSLDGRIPVARDAENIRNLMNGRKSLQCYIKICIKQCAASTMNPMSSLLNHNKDPPKQLLNHGSQQIYKSLEDGAVDDDDDDDVVSLGTSCPEVADCAVVPAPSEKAQNRREWMQTRPSQEDDYPTCQ